MAAPGLAAVVQNLVIAAYAIQADKAWLRGDKPYLTLRLDQIAGACEPAEQISACPSASPGSGGTPDRVAAQHVDHQVPGRIFMVGETGLINAGDREPQDGGVRRQRPVAAESVSRLTTLERGDRATVAWPPGELNVRVV